VDGANLSGQLLNASTSFSTKLPNTFDWAFAIVVHDAAFPYTAPSDRYYSKLKVLIIWNVIAWRARSIQKSDLPSAKYT